MKPTAAAEPKVEVIQTTFGVWRRFEPAKGMGFCEFTSHAGIGDWPLVHLCLGRHPETQGRATARGVVAIGMQAIGVVAIGQVAIGLVAVGQLALGVFVALGQAAVGIVAVGQAAAGVFAVGQFAAGRWSLGQFDAGGDLSSLFIRR